ncbi:MAG: choice-of-anchor B family protein [Bacteroidota bacterium]
MIQSAIYFPAICPSNSNWREITVIGDYAYVVSEGTDTLTGMQVIYLGDLPNSAPLVTIFDSTFTTAHIIERDILGDPNYVYVMGSDLANGVHIIDVTTPANPVEVGFYNPYYVHDAHIRGDTMYAAAIYGPWIDIVDISVKSNPVQIGQIVYSGAFSHSCWTTKDNTHLFVCDEVDGLLGKVFDIRDFNNISLVATYTANDSSLVHNMYIREDFGFISHNTEGLRVLDLVDPAVPVEVGYYDTWSGPSGGFNGLWSACPYFPSGKIIGGNRHDGLYVWEFNDTYAGRIYGEVVDSVTGNPIMNADVQISQTGAQTLTNLSGMYAFGEVPSGPSGYDVVYSANGYVTKTLTGVQLNGQDSLWRFVELAPMPIGVGETVARDVEVMAVPDAGQLRVNVAGEWGGLHGRLEVYDVAGKVLVDVDLGKNKTFFVPFSGVKNGVYFFRVTMEKDVVRRGKLVWMVK